MKANGTLAAGLYGKVPAHGDFLHRGLPSSFVEPWNGWISRSIVESRTILGDRWLQSYLTSPPWRFMVEPGLLGTDGWLGVLASSVDQVRRCYPMTVAVALPKESRLSGLTDAVDGLFDTLEQATLHLIDGNWTAEAVMTVIDELARTAPRAAIRASVLDRGGPERLTLGESFSPLAALAMRWRSDTGIRPGQTAPLSAWSHPSWSDLEPACLVIPGLPAPAMFASFLDGAWTDRGWAEGDEGGAPQ